jgi:hypothetical protein
MRIQHQSHSLDDMDPNLIPAMQLFQAEIVANHNPIRDVFDEPNPLLHSSNPLYIPLTIHQSQPQDAPTATSISNPTTNYQLPDPARIVAGSRHSVPDNPVVNGRRLARSVHPSNPNKLWCTVGRHWVHKDIFGAMNTCDCCRKKWVQ